MSHASRGWITYIPSHSPWGNMSIKVDSYTAANNGQTISVSPPQENFWPLHHKDLRCVYGVDSGKVRDSCIATDPAGTLFKLGATFSDEFGNSYTVTGLRNERFRVSDLK